MNYLIHIAKSAMVLAALFGVAIGYWSSWHIDIRESIEYGAYGGAASGLITTSIVAVADYLAKKRLSKTYPGLTHEATQVRFIQTNETYNVALSRARDVLGQLGAQIVEEDRERGLLIANRGLSWRSFGERLTVKVHRDGERATRVEVRSRPRIVSTMIDYGKNFENVERFRSLFAAQ